jgi:hypothetical protein
MNHKARIVFAGYLVRFPIGGYAWQTAHYLLGLKSLGYDVWFYEDTAHYSFAYNAISKEYGPSYDYGIKTAGEFLERIGFGDRWCFVDSQRAAPYGPGANLVNELLREADLLINFGDVNDIGVERRGGAQSVYIDSDPGFTQLRLVNGDEILRKLLRSYQKLFTFGENIGTPLSYTPTAGFEWHPTRQPVALEFWNNDSRPGSCYTTIGVWNTSGRDLKYQNETLHWQKRREWLRFLDLPSRTGASFELAMNVQSVPGDAELLSGYGWKLVDPEEVSFDPWRYRDYLCNSRAEFTVAKEMNIRLRTGWFSDRAACYMAAGRPAVEHDTGFGEVLPLGPGLHAFQTIDEAAEAVKIIEADYQRASAHAAEVARECFATDRVLKTLLQTAGFN